jgi:hypothetical protein
MIKLPQCLQCKYFHDEDTEHSTCDAFPQGIPEDILLSKFDHSKPFPGDNGIQFQLDREKQDRMILK